MRDRSNLPLDRTFQKVMTQEKNDPQPRKIRRNQVYLGLAVSAAVAAFAIALCSDEADESIDIVFYQTTAQCEADINKQQAEYTAALQQYQAAQLDEPPDPLPMQAKDCAPQMLAAQQEHTKTAPIYTSIADCQAEGVQCEATLASEQTAGYRPVYGGTYLNPYDSNYIYVNYSGSQYRVYEPRPVYRSVTSGIVVTPYGREISQPTTGRVTVPRHTTFAAPARPAGTSAAGTIRGRSSQGFGSSYKSSGSGGK
jgi:uncharacterized protein YgiB involved in biofilm formation